MKINFTIVYLKCNGGNRVLLDIANGLANKGHKVTITTFSDNADWFPNLKAKINTSLLLKPPKCDVSIATYCFTAFPMALSMWPIVSNAKRKFYYIQMYEPIFFANPIVKFFAKKSYSLPLEFITNSTWLHDLIEEKYGKDSHIVLNGVDIKKFKPKKTKPYKKGKLTVLCQYKSFPWKGMDILIKAMRIVNSKKKNIHLVFYGLEEPKNIPGKNWSWVSSPSDKDLVNLYNSVDMLVCPSLFESFPLPPIEAMACGTPVVVTDAGTTDYAIDRKNAIVVPKGDIKALADGIFLLANDKNLRKKFGEAGVKTAKEFSLENSIKEIERVFKESLNNETF
jgi:glycosyltransferase involved in cell wall biosynthesis